MTTPNNSLSTDNKTKWTAAKIALLITTIYFVLGNIVGYAVYTNSISVDNFLVLLFVPYTFTWGLSAMVGADWLSFVFIAIAFAGSFGVFFPIGLYLHKRNKKQ
jgi:hypothetical protein